MSIRSFRFPEVLLAPPTPVPCFYPHSHGPHWGPVHVGIRSQAQVHHHRDGPGLLGAAIFTTISAKDQWRLRSHPTKAVDVFANKTSRGWPPRYQLMLAIRSLLWLPECVAGNGSALVACFLPLACYAASAVGAPWRSGSY